MSGNELVPLRPMQSRSRLTDLSDFSGAMQYFRLPEIPYVNIEDTNTRAALAVVDELIDSDISQELLDNITELGLNLNDFLTALVLHDNAYVARRNEICADLEKIYVAINAKVSELVGVYGELTAANQKVTLYQDKLTTIKELSSAIVSEVSDSDAGLTPEQIQQKLEYAAESLRSKDTNDVITQLNKARDELQLCEIDFETVSDEVVKLYEEEERLNIAMSLQASEMIAANIAKKKASRRVKRAQQLMTYDTLTDRALRRARNIGNGMLRVFPNAGGSQELQVAKQQIIIRAKLEGIADGATQ